MELHRLFHQISHEFNRIMSRIPFLINIAQAKGVDATVNSVVGKIVDNVVYPAIILMFGLAVLMFIWGMINFFKGGDDPAAREQGQRHILWGIIGMAIMVSVFGIIRLVASSVGQSSTLGF